MYVYIKYLFTYIFIQSKKEREIDRYIEIE